MYYENDQKAETRLHFQNWDPMKVEYEYEDISPNEDPKLVGLAFEMDLGRLNNGHANLHLFIKMGW